MESKATKLHGNEMFQGFHRQGVDKYRKYYDNHSGIQFKWNLLVSPIKTMKSIGGLRNQNYPCLEQRQHMLMYTP